MLRRRMVGSLRAWYPYQGKVIVGGMECSALTLMCQFVTSLDFKCTKPLANPRLAVPLVSRHTARTSASPDANRIHDLFELGRFVSLAGGDVSGKGQVSSLLSKIIAA